MRIRVKAVGQVLGQASDQKGFRDTLTSRGQGKAVLEACSKSGGDSRRVGGK